MFLACSFWLVDAYLMIGRRDDAVRLFERLLALRNDLGLLSEQYEPSTRRLVGNFPQAFSHLALVTSASNLSHYQKPAEQRSERPAAGAPATQIPAPLSLLTGRRGIERVRASPCQNGQFEGGATCSWMFGLIRRCLAASRRNWSFTRNSAIRCSFAIWASRFAMRWPKPAN